MMSARVIGVQLSSREKLAMERRAGSHHSGKARGGAEYSLSLTPPKRSKQPSIKNFVTTGVAKLMKFITRRQS